MYSYTSCLYKQWKRGEFFLQQFTRRKSPRQTAAVVARFMTSAFVSLTLDYVTSFACIKIVRNTCKCLRYSQIFGLLSSVQGRKVGRIWMIQLLSSFLVLRARDLIFLTTDLQTLTYYSTIHCQSWSICYTKGKLTRFLFPYERFTMLDDTDKT